MKNITLLIVDDNPNNLRVLEGILRQAGYKVRPALNGETALRAAESTPPDLILLDIRMPEMDGFELCRRLKALPVTAEIPVIFISALQDVDDKIQAFKVGGVDYISKPFQGEEVLARVHLHIELGQARKNLILINEHLEEEVALRTRALLASNTQLERSMREEHALAELLALSHRHFADINYLQRALDSLAQTKAWLPPLFNAALLIDTDKAASSGRLSLAAVQGFDPERVRALSGQTLEEASFYACCAEQPPCEKILAALGVPAGQTAWVLPLATENKIFGLLIVASDAARLIEEQKFIAQVTEVLAMGIARRQADERLAWQAYHDGMTGLPNRRMLEEVLSQEINVAKSRGQWCGLLLVDLDQFKLLNDALGHGTGDLFLIECAKRLKATVRAGDTIFRWGGDEFIVLLPDIGKHGEDSATHAHAAANKIAHSLAVSFNTLGQSIHLNASVGIAFYPGDGDTVEELLKNVDLAMHTAKQAGRNCIHFFQREMQEEVQHHLRIDRELRTALNQNQFLLYYQPQLDATGRLIGAEALVRWNHPEHKLVSPDAFIPIAEETGLILPLGDWILETACRQLCTWGGSGVPSQRILAVNISARQFHQDDFVQRVRRIVERTGAQPDALELEVTESLLISDIDGVVRKMEALREMGIRFSVDDFGTGYSSLTYLKRLPVSQLKIDRSFVSGVHLDSRNAAIVRTIISLANNLGMKSIAEGVEEAEELDFLRGAGCDHFQGYFFDKPLSLTDFDRKWFWVDSTTLYGSSIPTA